MKILVVDDSSMIRNIVKSAAELLQLDMIEAEDGIEAMEIIEKSYTDIDLILLDWNMPEKSGFEVLVELKNSNKYKHIPVMMVTSEGQRSSIISAIRAGAANYLVKPFTVEELEVKINECIGKGRV